MRDLVTPLRMSVIGNPVDCSALRSWLTVPVGTACFSTAQAPVTCGVAIDVPLATPKPPPVTDDWIELPGANSDMNGATLENDEIASDFVVDPTLIADEMQPGASSVVDDPSLPAAMTVAMPTERRLSMLGFSGSLSQGALDRPPP